jgi:hypothetical protein
VVQSNFPTPIPSQLDLLLQEVNYITYYLGKAGNGASCPYLLRFFHHQELLQALLLGYRSSVYIHPSSTSITWSRYVYSAESRHKQTNHTNHKPDLHWSTGTETTNSSFIPPTSFFPACQASPSCRLRQVSFQQLPTPNSQLPNSHSSFSPRNLQ